MASRNLAETLNPFKALRNGKRAKRADPAVSADDLSAMYAGQRKPSELREYDRLSLQHYHQSNGGLLR